MLGPVVHDVGQHLPHRDPLVGPGKPGIVERGQPGVEGGPLGIPGRGERVQRGQRLALRPGHLGAAGQPVAPPLVGAEGMDEDLPEVARPDRLAGRPLGLAERPGRRQDSPRRPSVVGEQEPDVVDLHRRIVAPGSAGRKGPAAARDPRSCLGSPVGPYRGSGLPGPVPVAPVGAGGCRPMPADLRRPPVDRSRRVPAAGFVPDRKEDGSCRASLREPEAPSGPTTRKSSSSRRTGTRAGSRCGGRPR